MKKKAAIIATTAVMAAFISTSSAHALMFCHKPSKPYIPSYATQKYEMENARDEVERYTELMRTYIRCLVEEQEQSVSEHKRLIDEWNTAVSNYNNR